MELNNELNFSELSKLFMLLSDADIPCEIRHVHDGLQVVYPSVKDCVCDAVCHSYSYGHEKGLLEIMGLVNEEEIGDTVEGWLTADEVFKRISAHSSKNK